MIGKADERNLYTVRCLRRIIRKQIINYLIQCLLLCIQTGCFTTDVNRRINRVIHISISIPISQIIVIPIRPCAADIQFHILSADQSVELIAGIRTNVSSESGFICIPCPIIPELLFIAHRIRNHTAGAVHYKQYISFFLLLSYHRLRVPLHTQSQSIGSVVIRFQGIVAGREWQARIILGI